LRARRILGVVVWAVGTFLLALLVPLVYSIIRRCYSAVAMFPHLATSFWMGILGIILSVAGIIIVLSSAGE